MFSAIILNFLSQMKGSKSDLHIPDSFMEGEITLNIWEIEFKPKWNKMLISTECSKCFWSVSASILKWSDLFLNYTVKSSLKLHKVN